MNNQLTKSSQVPISPLCLIPAKGTSRRFPRKNIALLKGRPVISYVIDTARTSGVFDTIYVSTDDAETAGIARAEGATVLERPAELATDDVPVTAVGVHALDLLARQGKNYDAFCAVYPTAALMLPKDLQGGWKLFQDVRANAVIAMTEYYEHPLLAYRTAGRFKRRMTRRVPGLQTYLHPYQVPSGYFYMIKSDLLRKYGSYDVPRLAAYPIPRQRSVDIDEPEHLTVAEALYSLIEPSSKRQLS